MNKRVFMYWVDKVGRSIPAYIQLCLQTWFEHIPDLELVVINHDNLVEWVGDVIDMKRFLRLSLPMQSDIVSYQLLAKYGGIFMDADTIITRDIFEEVAMIDPHKLVAFGYPNTHSIHVAILMSLLPNNKLITSAADMALERLNSATMASLVRPDWDYFSNDIFTTLLNDGELRTLLHVLDRTETGNILESHYFQDMDTYEQYQIFYFAPHEIRLENVLEKIRFGAISLHNSWTPDGYKALTLDGVLESATMMSAIIRYALEDFLSS